MHEDGTEHEWVTILVQEQGDWLPVASFCRRCGLTADDLLEDMVDPLPPVDLAKRLEGW